MIGLLINKIFADTMPSYRVYPVRAPQGTNDFPFAVYQILSETQNEEKNSAYQPTRTNAFTYTDVASTYVTRVQLSVVSNTYSSLETLSILVENNFNKLYGHIGVTDPAGANHELKVDKINLIDRADLFDNDGEYQGTQGTYMRAIDFEFRMKL